MSGSSKGRVVAAGIVTAGVLGGLLVVAGGADAQPQLPPVAPEDLVSSVLAAPAAEGNARTTNVQPGSTVPSRSRTM